jgi:hypothetical protein
MKYFFLDSLCHKLQITIEALRTRPDMSDEALAEFLSLKRPASARFWRLKAIEILNASDKGKEATQGTAPSASRGSRPTPGALVNGTGSKR